MNTKMINISLNNYKNTYENVTDIGETIAGFIDESGVLCETDD